jgi:AmiR/NasT family two-component response regulator
MILTAEDRKTIGQAKGILMERYGIVRDDARELLITASRSYRIKLTKVAVTLVHTAATPPETGFP